MDVLELIGRKNPLLHEDVNGHENELNEKVRSSSFLILGAAGSIGSAVTKEIFKRNPKKLHLVDISENNLVELVRDLRSSEGYTDGPFQTLALDIGSPEYDAFIASDGQYDYVLNLSALKHVRSERDPYTLMRMVRVNILNTIKTIEQSIQNGTKKYFCVSTDKAANPVNMMGATKRVMEMFLLKYSDKIDISTARFANVAFSDGSLLHGFRKRIEKEQPIVAPNDVRRYFVTPEESGQLCMMSSLMGENGDIFFPKLSEELDLMTFSDIARNFLTAQNLQAVETSSEQEARDKINTLDLSKYWPTLFVKSDTTGEKDFEEFFIEGEVLDMDRFQNLGIVKNNLNVDFEKLEVFQDRINEMIETGKWTKEELVSMISGVIPNLEYEDKGKYLDSKM